MLYFMGYIPTEKGYKKYLAVTIISVLWLMASASWTDDLNSLLTENDVIRSRGRYGYSSHDLNFCEGNLVRKKVKDSYRYFSDLELTDAERFLLASGMDYLDENDHDRVLAKKKFGFNKCYDPNRAFWEGMCHQSTAASTHPHINNLILETEGLICPVKSGKDVLLSPMTLRELSSYFFTIKTSPSFFGGRLSYEHDTRGLKPHEFHVHVHSLLRKKRDVIINVGPPGIVFNRVIKKIVSKQVRVKRPKQQISSTIPSEYDINSNTKIYSIESIITYYDFVKFHDKGGLFDWTLKYIIFIDPTHPENVHSIWLGAPSYRVHVPGDEYVLTGQPSFIFSYDWSETSLTKPGLEQESLGLKILLDLFDQCVKIKDAKRWIRKSQKLVTQVAKARTQKATHTAKAQLLKSYQRIKNFPLKEDIRVSIEDHL